MKKNLAIYSVLSVLFLLGSFSQVNALPIGRSNLSREYLVSPEDLSPWSIGLYSGKIERNVTLNGYTTASMKANKTMGYIGYDVIPWITVYAVAGSAQTKIGWSSSDSSTAEYGLGAMFNLIDTEIEDPTSYENRLRLSGHVQYTRGSAKINSGFSEANWDDLSGSLTLSLVNDLDGDKFFLPNSIALFIGPVFSLLNSSEIKEDAVFGMTAGMDIFLNEKVSLEIAYIKYDAGTFCAGVNVRF